MNLKRIGKKIKKLRIEFNYTQKELAEILNVTDKAVSKWERGESFPETSIYHKMSKVFDVDMDYLLFDSFMSNDWHGFIIYDKKLPINKKVYDKPLINYLLQYFMLSRIKKITIKTDVKNQSLISNLGFRNFGLDIDFRDYLPKNKNVMVLTEPILLFGANLTRYFESCMDGNINKALYLNSKLIPIYFIKNNKNFLLNTLNFEKCNLTRGIICLSLSALSEIKTASSFVEIYQNSHNCKIADINELALNRGFI